MYSVPSRLLSAPSADQPWAPPTLSLRQICSNSLIVPPKRSRSRRKRGRPLTQAADHQLRTTAFLPSDTLRQATSYGPQYVSGNIPFQRYPLTPPLHTTIFTLFICRLSHNRRRVGGSREGSAMFRTWGLLGLFAGIVVAHPQCYPENV